MYSCTDGPRGVNFKPKPVVCSLPEFAGGERKIPYGASPMNHAHLHRTATRPLAFTALSAAFALACCSLPAAAQTAPLTAKTDAPPQTHYVPAPAFDTSSIDPKADRSSMAHPDRVAAPARPDSAGGTR